MNGQEKKEGCSVALFAARRSSRTHSESNQSNQVVTIHEDVVT